MSQETADKKLLDRKARYKEIKGWSMKKLMDRYAEIDPVHNTHFGKQKINIIIAILEIEHPLRKKRSVGFEVLPGPAEEVFSVENMARMDDGWALGCLITDLQLDPPLDYLGDITLHVEAGAFRHYDVHGLTDEVLAIIRKNSRIVAQRIIQNFKANCSHLMIEAQKLN